MLTNSEETLFVMSAPITEEAATETEVEEGTSEVPTARETSAKEEEE